MGNKRLSDKLPVYGLVGEMATADIKLESLPLSDEARASLEKLMDGDEDPCLVAVEIEEGRGGHGNYTAEAIKDIVDGVNQDHPMGFLGHQEPDKLPFEFPQPATHWFAAEMVKRGGKAVAKVYGLVEPTMTHLKRWVRSGRINSVSIFGRAHFRPGTKDVVGYDLMSIDWTPRRRAGMTTRLLWASEMAKDGVSGELDGSYEELRNAIQAAAKKELGGNWVWVERLYTDGAVIVVHEPEGGAVRTLYRFDYSVDGDEVTLSNRAEVKEHRSFEPTGEMDGSHEALRQALYEAARAQFGGEEVYVDVERVYDDSVIIVRSTQGTRRMYAVPYTVEDGRVVFGDSQEVELQVRREYVPAGEQKGVDVMGLKEKLAAIRAALAKGETAVAEVLGEIGITKEQAIEAVAKDEWAKLSAGAKLGVALKESLGLSDDMTLEQAKALTTEMAAVWQALGFDKNKPENPAEVVGEMAQAQADAARAAREKMIDEAVKSKVAGEQAQALVKRMLNVRDDATEEQIVGEIDALLADEAVKGVLGNTFVDKPAGTSTAPTGEQRQYTATKRAAI